MKRKLLMWLLFGSIFIIAGMFIIQSAFPTGNVGGCAGEVWACSQLIEEECTDQLGCTDEGICEGDPEDDCGIHDNFEDCDSFGGSCFWTSDCQGTPTQCMGLTREQCGEDDASAQFGCEWSNCTYNGDGDWLVYCDECSAIPFDATSGGIPNIDLNGNDLYIDSRSSSGTTNIQGNITFGGLAFNQTQCRIGNTPDDGIMLINE